MITFALVILLMGVAGFVTLLVFVRRYGNFLTSVPALVWFLVVCALYSARIIEAEMILRL